MLSDAGIQDLVKLQYADLILQHTVAVKSLDPGSLHSQRLLQLSFSENIREFCYKSEFIIGLHESFFVTKKYVFHSVYVNF